MIESPLDRFNAKVNKTDTCWLWTGSTRGATHYGWFKVNGKRKASHRFAYETFNGPIAEGKIIMHTCDVPRCVNPSHLIQGTYKDNMQDCISKGRFNPGGGIKTYCKQGHPLQGNNIINEKNGLRKCRECHNRRRREYRKNSV